MSTHTSSPVAEKPGDLHSESTPEPVAARRAPRRVPGLGTAVVAMGVLVVGLTLAFSLGQSSSGNANNVPVSSATALSTPAPAAAPAAVVIIGSSPGTDSTAAVSFVPTSVTIHAGQTVEWVWRDSSVPQNVAFAAGFHSATQTSGTYFHTFETPGIFAFTSTVHFDMSGQVVVR